MYVLIVEFSHINYAYTLWNKVYLMPDGSVLVLVMFPLFSWLTRVTRENHLCSRKQSQPGPFSGYPLEKNVLKEILDLPSTPRHVKKTRKSPQLGYILLS